MAGAIVRLGEINALDCRREAERRSSSENMFSSYVGVYRQVLSHASVSEWQAV
jgi:hypothetical protein